MTPRLRPGAPASLRASGDRWLFGYADVVTLLFACFAALYAAQVSATKAAGPAAPAVHAPATDLTPALQSIVARHADLRVELSPNASGLVISVPETGSFAPGRADLSAPAERVLTDLAATLKTQPYLLRVEGHTDDVPIRNAVFESNWALSSARATRVVRLLIEQGQLAPERLSAAAYAEYRPRVPNDSPPARARNRRVDIVVLGAAAVQDRPGGADYSGAETRSSGGR